MIYATIPLQEGITKATITIYVPESCYGNENRGGRPAVILCPGGAYMGITEKEAEPVALRFLSEGFCAFVLRYSIGAELARFPSPFIDAAAAVRMVRENAEHWGIHPDKIGICGFSTGGQVATVLAATWREDYFVRALMRDSIWYRPNALLLGYPLLDFDRFLLRNQGKSPEQDTLLQMLTQTTLGTAQPEKSMLEEWNVANRVSPDMPPTFLWTTAEDQLISPEDYEDFLRALTKHCIPHEFHVFEKGSHGVSLGDRTVGYSDEEIKGLGNTPEWAERAIHWVRQQLDV